MLTYLNERLTLFRYASNKNNNLVIITVAAVFFAAAAMAIVFGIYGIKEIRGGKDERSWPEVFASAKWRVDRIGAQVMIGIAAALSLGIVWRMGLGLKIPQKLKVVRNKYNKKMYIDGRVMNISQGPRL